MQFLLEFLWNGTPLIPYEESQFDFAHKLGKVILMKDPKKSELQNELVKLLGVSFEEQECQHGTRKLIINDDGSIELYRGHKT